MVDLMAEYGSPLLEAAATVHVVMISEQFLLAVMEVFLSIVGCGAGGRELRFRRLEPLTWIFGKKCWHDAYGYVCFGRGGIHFCAATAARRRRRGGGC